MIRIFLKSLFHGSLIAIAAGLFSANLERHISSENFASFQTGRELLGKADPLIDTVLMA